MDVTGALVVEDDRVRLPATDPGPKVLLQMLPHNDRLCSLGFADPATHIPLDDVAGDDRSGIGLFSADHADPDIAVVVDDAVGEGASHTRNADRRDGPFGLDRAFLVAQFFGVQVEMLFPEGLVIRLDIGDGEAGQRAPMAITMPGCFPSLPPPSMTVAAVHFRPLVPLESSPSLRTTTPGLSVIRS